MTLNGVLVIILHYLAKFGSQLCKSGWLAVDMLIVSQPISYSAPTKHNGLAVLFAVEELLVVIGVTSNIVE